MALQESKETGYDSTADTTYTEYYVFSLIIPITDILCLILWSFSSLCDVLQGPEGSVGARGLRGLQVSNILVVTYAIHVFIELVFDN